MSIPNLIPHKTLYISGYIYSYYAFVFIFEFPEHISKHILQFHTFFLSPNYNPPCRSRVATDFYNYEKNACFIGRLSMVGGV